MTSLFIKLLNLSISAGMLVLFVFVLRFILKRTSRRATCLLWVVVGLRLVIPFSFESNLSVIPSGDFVKLNASEKTGAVYTGKNNINENQQKISTVYTAATDDNSEIDYYIDSKQTTDFEKGRNNSENDAEQSSLEHDNIEQSYNIKNSIEQDYTEQNNDVKIALPTQMPSNTVKAQSNNDNAQRNGTNNSTSEEYYISSSNNVFGYPAKYFWGVIAYLWLFGVVVIIGYALVGYIHMKRITAASMKLENTILSESIGPRVKINFKNVYICDRLEAAFIFGIIHPRIYLPSNLDETQLENVIAHEHVHILRRDYIWKLVGFMMLAVYWFNPLVWLAYAFLCRDIEFACDEQVISGMNTDEVKKYSETLLYCSTNLHFMYGCPLAFGEIAVKDRVKAALNYKKPLFWVIIVVFVILVVGGVIFFTKPSAKLSENEVSKSNEQANMVTTDRIVSNDEITSEPKNESEIIQPKDITDYGDELFEEVKNHVDIDSTYKLLNTLSMKYRYSVIHDFDFIYVMPNGTEFGTEFGYSAGMDFREYCKLWNDFDGIIHDEELTKPWIESRESINGYLALATNNGYQDSQYGYKIFIKDGYIHLFSVDKSKEEYAGEIDYRSPYQMRSSYNPQTDEYMWSAKLKDDYQPNMYSIRRILFNKDMYDIYVQNCDYDIYITEPDVYNLNRGYLVDLDGDGIREKLFVASCGWIDKIEPDNMWDFVSFRGHHGTDYDTYFGNYPKSLIYINGELQNGEYTIADEVNLPYVFAITDIDRKDGRLEILITCYSEHQVDEYFYIWKNGKLSEPKWFNGSLIQVNENVLEYKADHGLVYVPETKFIAEFHGDGTFSGQGDVSIWGEFGGYRMYSHNITWRMDADGNIETVGNIFDIPVNYENEREFLNSLSNAGLIEYWEDALKNNPEEFYSNIFLKLELDLNVSVEADAESPKTHMLPGYVVIDKTDAKSKIHIRYMTDGIHEVDVNEAYTGLSGWVDLADIEAYISDPEAFAKAKEESPYNTVIDTLFSNLNHAG